MTSLASSCKDPSPQYRALILHRHTIPLATTINHSRLSLLPGAALDLIVYLDDGSAPLSCRRTGEIW
jgi:hypothetical protein